MNEREEQDISKYFAMGLVDSAMGFCEATAHVIGFAASGADLIRIEFDRIWYALETQYLRIKVVPSSGSTGFNASFLDVASTLSPELFVAEIRTVAADMEVDLENLSVKAELGTVWSIIDKLESKLIVQRLTHSELQLRHQFSGETN